MSASKPPPAGSPVPSGPPRQPTSPPRPGPAPRPRVTVTDHVAALVDTAPLPTAEQLGTVRGLLGPHLTATGTTPWPDPLPPAPQPGGPLDPRAQVAGQRFPGRHP